MNWSPDRRPPFAAKPVHSFSLLKPVPVAERYDHVQPSFWQFWALAELPPPADAVATRSHLGPDIRGTQPGGFPKKHLWSVVLVALTVALSVGIEERKEDDAVRSAETPQRLDYDAISSPHI